MCERARETARAIKRSRDSRICRWLSRVFWFELCWRFFYILIVKKQHESISVWCANINSFKEKVSLAPRLSYLTALREGTPVFGYTSVTSVHQDHDGPESLSSETRQHCRQQRASQVTYWAYWELTNIFHTSAHEFISSLFVLESLLGFRVKLKIVLFSKEALNWSKMTVQAFIMLKRLLFQINAVLLKLSIP